jgi:hypothetical protein
MFALIPQSKSKKNIENELAERKQQYESVLKTNKEETKIQLEEEIEQLRNKLKYFVIDFEDSANLTFDISRIAREQQIGSFNIKDRGKAGISKIPDCDYIGENYIDISFAGQFNQFVVFLNTLERYQPVIFVDEFSVTRSGSWEERGNRANLSVAVFVRK